MSTFSEQTLREKLSRLTSSQESIETLSMWIIHFKTNAKVISEIWMEQFSIETPDRRLLLLFLVNDVLQNGRRKGANVFLDVFQDPLRHASSIIRGLNIKTSVGRILNIWKERKIYDNTFLKELEDVIGLDCDDQGGEKMNFKISLLDDSLVEMKKFEGELEGKLISLNSLKLDVTNASSLTKLKDKASGAQFKREFYEEAHKIQDFTECVGIEVSERKNLMSMLNDCKNYHKQNLIENQRLLKDYGKIQSHFEALREKLKEKIDELHKAKHTATSDPNSKDDITVVGDMEIDSDTEDQIAPPTEPHPLAIANQFIPPPIPPLMNVPSPAFPAGSAPNSFVAPPLLTPLPPRPLLFPNVPYSPSMPKPYTPLTPPNQFQSHFTPPPLLTAQDTPIPQDSAQRIMPILHDPAHMATPGIQDSTHVTTPLGPLDQQPNDSKVEPSNTLPDSFFHDYSDSDSDLDDGDKPYSPSHMVFQSPEDKTATPTPNVENSNSSEMHSPLDKINNSEQAKKLRPEDFKITPSLTNLLGQLFPQLSKSLEERKRKPENDYQQPNTKFPCNDEMVNTPRANATPTPYEPRPRLSPISEPHPSRYGPNRLPPYDHRYDYSPNHRYPFPRPHSYAPPPGNNAPPNSYYQYRPSAPPPSLNPRNY